MLCLTVIHCIGFVVCLFVCEGVRVGMRVCGGVGWCWGVCLCVEVCVCVVYVIASKSVARLGDKTK